MLPRILSLIFVSALSCGLFIGGLACIQVPPLPAVRAWHELGAAETAIEDDERTLWRQAQKVRKELEDGEHFFADENLSTYLNGVLRGLLHYPLPAEAPVPAVYVLRATDQIAWTFADGLILFSTSQLARLQNEAQLASLLGHELAHFLARHSLIKKRFSKLSSSTVERMDVSRDQEIFSDRLGLDLMREAGYDPREALRMLILIERDNVNSSGSVRAWRSHPFVPERIKALRGEIAHEVDADARVGEARYSEAIADLLLASAEIELSDGLLDRADSSIMRHLQLRPESGRGYYVQAEITRRTMPDGGQSGEVRLAYERALEFAPDDPDVLRALGLLYHKSGDASRSTEMFTNYLHVTPDAVDRKIIERYLERDREAAR